MLKDRHTSLLGLGPANGQMVERKPIGASNVMANPQLAIKKGVNFLIAVRGGERCFVEGYFSGHGIVAGED